MKLKSLSHAGVTVSNLDKAIRWYWEVVGMSVVDVQEFEAAYVEKMKALYKLQNCSLRLAMLVCPKGGCVELFEFSQKEPMQHRWNAPGVTHFTLDVSGIEEWYAKLAARNDAELLCTPQKTGKNQWFFFRDPDGNLIELIDLKGNYFLLRRLTRLAKLIMRKGPFKQYYQ